MRGRKRVGDTGGWDSLNDSVLPFTFHTRTLLAPPGGGGREEVCGGGVYGVGWFAQGRKTGRYILKMLLLYVYLVLDSQGDNKTTHKACGDTQNTHQHVHMHAQACAHKRTC